MTESPAPRESLPREPLPREPLSRDPLPRNDPRRVSRLPAGLIADANDIGILHAADVHVARRLAAMARESDPEVVLALALATRAVRTGSVAVDLHALAAVDPDFAWPADVADWLARVAASPLVTTGVLRLDDGLLYLERYHDQEVLVAETLGTRRALHPIPVHESELAAGLGRLFPDPRDADQRAAAELAVRERTAVITGGPGTGKTTTIARILALLAEQSTLTDGFHVPRFALAAPTAKAAARLQDAFATAAAGLPDSDRERLPIPAASTLHRLLGWRPGSRSRFAHDAATRLPHDVVVVDEASMVSLTMMARLLEALRPTARLIVVGDPDQLTSVEAGAVLADLVAGLDRDPAQPAGSSAVARLRHTYRFGGAIQDLATAIRDGDATAALAILTSGDPAVELVPNADARRSLMVEAAVDLRRHGLAGDARAALAALGEHRLLCAHRTGPQGVGHWNRQIAQWLSEETGENFYAPMFPGRPLQVTANDYAMDLYNGDTGVVLRRDGRLVAVFDSGSQLREVAAARLADVETMYAATVHKSQGSQATRVTVVLPELDSPLLTRELIYTAATRAQKQLTIIGTPEVIERGMAQRIQRASGLAKRLRRPPPAVPGEVSAGSPG